MTSSLTLESFSILIAVIVGVRWRGERATARLLSPSGWRSAARRGSSRRVAR
ncbi:hypothetical protein D3C81_1945060 [compost metagenome]